MIKQRHGIFKHIIALGTVFVLGLFSLILANYLSDQLRSELDTELTNSRARISIGKAITLDLILLERDFNMLVNTEGPISQQKVMNNSALVFQNMIAAFSVLQKGGTLTLVNNLNTPGVDQVLEEIHFQPDENQGYVLEVIDLHPKTLQIWKKMAQLNRMQVQMQKAEKSGDLVAINEFRNQIGLFLKGTHSHITRMRENTNRLYFNSIREMESLSAMIATRKDRIQQVRNVVVLFIILATTLFGGLLAHQANKIHTDLNNARKAAQRARQESEKANESKSEFLATMSHEIRTPMNGVIGMASLLGLTEMTEEQRSYTDIIRSSGQGLLDIINDILDFSKIEAGMMKLESIPFNFHDCVEGVGDMIAMQAQTKGLNLPVIIDRDVPRDLLGDATRLRQVMLNLMGNAVKFTENGNVVLHASVEKQDDDTATVLIQVKDTGIGIPKERISTLFSAFTQADSSTTREFGGTGLGLAISSNLVDAMGGQIKVESTVGEGSNFFFSITLDKQESISSELDLVLKDDSFMFICPDWECGKGFAEQIRRLGGQARHVESVSQASAILDGMPPESRGINLVASYQIGEDGAEALAKYRQDNGADKFSKLIISVPISKPIGLNAWVEKYDGYFGRPLKTPALGRNLKAILNSEEKPKQERSRIQQPTSFADLKTLLVEDNEINQLVAGQILGTMGISHDVADNGQQALTMWEKEDYDLILMDCQMPVMDGYQATIEIRQKETALQRHPIIVAMTANALTDDRQRCLDIGMDEFMAKPIDVEMVEKILVGLFHINKRHSKL